MSSFDFSDIEQVNRIELQPNEVVVFQTPYPLSDADVGYIKQQFEGSPLEGRVYILSGDWQAVTVDAGEKL